jgi:hypothetical protein
MASTVTDPNIPNIKWPVPFEKDAKPIGWAYYIYIKNSKSLNKKSIKKFIEERYFDYEHIFCIDEIDEHFFLKFSPRFQDICERVYQRLISKQRIIDNIHIEFDKPVSVYIFTFKDYELLSPIPSPTESTTFDFPSIDVPPAETVVKPSTETVVVLPVETKDTDVQPKELPRISYVFVDHSNIVYGGKHEGYTIKTNFISQAIESNSPWICQRHIVGSGMFPAIIKSWEHCSYVVDNSPPGPEYDVDAILHTKIINIITNSQYPERSNLIIATGDGNRHNGACSFPGIVEMALNKGWTVELYSWKSALSPVFLKINNPGFKINLLNDLEPFKSQQLITFNPSQSSSVKQSNVQSYQQNGNQLNGTSRNGNQRNGTPRNETQRNETTRNETTRNETPRNGNQRNGTPRNGNSRNDKKKLDIGASAQSSLSLGISDFPPLK